MGKRLKRILSAVLAMLIFAVVLLPDPAPVAAATASDIKKQIRRTYNKALDYFGRDSFDGYCGSLINAQLYILGITSGIVHNNGNEEYNEYCDQDVTSGGYRVQAYPARRYTLREALLDITQNGTQDAYNILVGFERTKSVAGRRYGHAVFVHAIFDGMVYFVESYDVKLNGSYYDEGTPIICSIEDFCNYYASTTVELDGVIEFGLKNYEARCDRYSASLTAAVTTATALMSQPCRTETDKGSEELGWLEVGEVLTVTGLYLNDEGEYWYRIGEDGYVQADFTAVQTMNFDDVTVEDAVAPTVLRQSEPFKVKGLVSARYNSIYTLRAQVYRLDGETEAQVLSATDVVEGQEYSLSGSVISKKLTFRTLEVGQYRYTLAAIVGNHYYQDGQLQISWNTVELWKSDFQVSEDQTGSCIVTFDAGDGQSDWNQTAVVKGDALGELPGAQREGFAFLGWYTAAEGDQAVTGEYVPQDGVTLYARWYDLAELSNNWQSPAGQSRYMCTVGLSTMGCAEVDGTLYYFSTFGQDWVVWTEDGTIVN